MNLEIDKWIEHCDGHYTQRTIGLYRRCITEFEAYLSNDGNQLTTQAIEAYILDRRNAGWSNRYVNCNLSVIKSYCKWFYRLTPASNPAKPVKMLKEKPPKRRILEVEEYQKVMATISGQDKDIIAFLANTGLRASEFVSLAWADISPDFTYLEVVHGKGDKSRFVPLNQVCRDILAKYKPQGMAGTLPFCRMHRVSLGKVCVRAAKKADIKRFGPHACRHYFATILMHEGVSIYKISKILGHASVVVTEKVYLHLGLRDILGVTDILCN